MLTWACPVAKRVRLSRLVRRHELDEVDRGAEVGRVRADGQIVTTEGRDTRTVQPGQRRRANLADHLRRVLALGAVVHVRPVAQEDQFAVLEGDPAFLFLPGDCGLRDGAVLEPSVRKLNPSIASGVLTLGLPESSVITPPAELIDSAKLQVSPSYFWN